MKILIVEDEPGLSQEISTYLAEDGFVCEEASTFDAAMEKAGIYHYDVAVIDIGLPDGSGFDIITFLKENSPDTGLLVISARNSLDDKLHGLHLGADDYITKPFHLAELNARIKALIRRSRFDGSLELCHQEIIILPDEGRVTVNDKEIILTRKEYDLLLFLISAKNRLLTKESIAEHLWGDNIDLACNFDFIYTHINNLRKKIKLAGGKDYIKTVYGLGYKFTDQCD